MKGKLPSEIMTEQIPGPQLQLFTLTLRHHPPNITPNEGIVGHMNWVDPITTS